MMKINAGRLPSSATLRIGARPPIQREHNHSEARKKNPTHNPKTRMPASLSTMPRKLHPRTSNGQRGGNDSNVRLFQNSFSEGICATLRVLVSSRHRGPAYIAVRTSNIAENAVPANATAVSAPGFGGRTGDVDLRLA